MSKLYKNLQYDTDYVMQPGDPLTNPDGNNRVQVNDNGTASIITGTQYEFTLTVPEIQGASFRVRIGKSNSTGDGYSRLILSITGIENAVADQYGGAGYSINGEYAGEIAVLMTDASFADVGQPLPDSSKRIPIFGGFYVNFYVRSLGRTSSWCDWSNLSSATEIDEQIISTSGHKHTASDINYGQLAVTYGGTGVDGSSQAANKVLASPSSGTGAVSFRSLEAVDIPDLSTSKLTTGTLGVARGGTGKISHTVNSVIIGGISTTGALQNVASASGAFYSTGSNKKPTFGTLPVAQGGTGVDGSSQAINKVLASPASGSAGAISFRSLVEADIPTLSTSKISGLGNAATKNVGTASGTVAAGNHTHDAANITYNDNNSYDTVAACLTDLVNTNLYLLTTPEQTTSTTTTTNDTITVQLSDHAVNTVQVPTTATNVVMKFPGQAIGKARDFMVRLIVTGETVPSITLTEPDGSAIDFDVDDDSWTEIEQGVNLLMFTETAQ